MGRVCITVNLIIDQIIILYLLLHEIICLDDENFLVSMYFGTFNFNMYHRDISVKFHFTDLVPCRPSRAAGPSTIYHHIHPISLLNIIPPISLLNIVPPISLLNIVPLSYLNYAKFLINIYNA